MALILPTTAPGQQNDASWKNLNQLTHRASFIFATKRRDCVTASLKSTNDTSLTVKLRDGMTEKVQRDDLLRINYGESARGVLFSGRSSWLDVRALSGTPAPKSLPKVIVETKAGNAHQGTLMSVSSDRLMVRSGNKELELAKGEIATISYVVPKPVSASASYADEELVFLKVFDPELWPTLFGLQGSLVVRLFDASMPEDDSEIVCKGSGPPVVNLTRY